MRTPVMYMHDPFDAYFARARLDELEQQQMAAEAAEQKRRGSLPSPCATLQVQESSGCRRTRSCKLPSRKSRGSRRNSKSPTPRKNSSSGDNDASPTSEKHSRGESPANGISLSYVNEPTLRAPSPRLSVKCHSAPHSRSASWKKQRRPKSIRMRDRSGGESPENGQNRSRSGSGSVNFEDEVAAKLEQLKVLQEKDVCVVRNFSSSRKGVINRGDSFKRKSRNIQSMEREIEPLHSLPVLGSVDDGTDQRSLNVSNNLSPTEGVDNPASTPTIHKVVVTGDHGVGKTSLLQQFMTSDYMGAIGTVVSTDDCEKYVTIAINNEEATINFVDADVEMNLRDIQGTDAYVLVYSITSKSSFQYVLETIQEVRRWPFGQKVAVIVVANKSDLVRKRAVSESDAKDMCNHYDCKYIETSAALNHQVDELLVGIVTQIRLNQKRQDKLKKFDSMENTTCVKTAKGLLSRLFLRKPVYHVSKSCDNLLDL